MTEDRSPPAFESWAKAKLAARDERIYEYARALGDARTEIVTLRKAAAMAARTTAEAIAKLQIAEAKIAALEAALQRSDRVARETVRYWALAEEQSAAVIEAIRVYVESKS